MRSPLFLSILALTLAGQGLRAQEGDRARAMPVGGRRVIRTPSESSGPDRAQPTGGRVAASEGDQGGRALGPMRRPHRTPDTVPDVPRALPRCTEVPEVRFWKSRDLMAEIQLMARRGFVPVTPVSGTATELSGVADFPAGWKSYGFLVPAGGKLHVRLHHPNEGWFRVAMVNKWGSPEKGMLQNLIPTGNPEASYQNLSKETRAVYVIVDDPGWMSSKAYPFALDIKRDWEPGQEDPKTKLVEGIWAANKVESVNAQVAVAK